MPLIEQVKRFVLEILKKIRNSGIEINYKFLTYDYDKRKLKEIEKKYSKSNRVQFSQRHRK